MKIVSVIKKSFREQVRNFWILVLTVSMAPFFVGVYYLILESYVAKYDLLVVNHDLGMNDSSGVYNHGKALIDGASLILADSTDLPFRVKRVESREVAMDMMRNRKADALIVIPGDFSSQISRLTRGGEKARINIEFIGDLTNIEYMVSAVWANAAISQYLDFTLPGQGIIHVTETSLGTSGSITEFELMVPGLLIIALIMLMFSATIAIVAEVENKTIMRLKLSNLSTFEFLAGVSIVQVMVGMVSILLTLAVAIAAGFSHYSSLGMLIFIAILTSLSIFAFSLILAAVTKTVNEVLIVGNFPLFLFMFFTGAAFPLDGKALFHIGGYPVSVQGLMSPTHSISALKKVMIMEMSLRDILPEILVLIFLTVIYFIIGLWAFRRRHMRVE